MTYSVQSYGQMIEPGPRLDAYMTAMRNVIKPGSTVVDIGTGTGFFAIVAARLGAKRVYAIEADEAIQVGREMAKHNGVEDRVTFLYGKSTDIELDEKVDVIVSDLRGALPLYGTHIPSLIDARTRFLKPAGVLLPRKDTIKAAVAHHPKSYRGHVEPWAPAPDGYVMEPQRQRTVNTWYVQRVERQSLRTAPVVWTEIDYATVEDPDVSNPLLWEVERSGTAHGLSVWFDAEIGEGCGFTTGADGPELVYGSAFFPFERPLDLNAGDRLHVDFTAKLIGDEYTWVWNTRLEGPEGGERAAFRQSTMRGAPVTSDRLRQRASDFVPDRSEQGEIDWYTLGLMDGVRPLSRIAEKLVERYPETYPSASEALAHVGDMAVRYARNGG